MCIRDSYFSYDLMRAAAMLLIVFYHMNCEWSARLMESPLVVTKIGAQGYIGWQGVSLFILVSGAAQCISCLLYKSYQAEGIYFTRYFRIDWNQTKLPVAQIHLWTGGEENEMSLIHIFIVLLIMNLGWVMNASFEVP